MATDLEIINHALKPLLRGYRSNRYLDAVRPNIHLKQKWFLAMEHLEVMYGGAAGGGKSDALLMAALQYVDIPGYAAILFRNSYTDLALPGAIMDRASTWLQGTGAIKRDGGHKWEFPGGGSIQFAYMETDADRYRYKSAEFQFVGFDESTGIPFTCYKYLFSRLRKPSDRNNPLSQVPLRMRSATNPGGKYHEDIKNYFVPKRYLESDEETQFSKVWATVGDCGVCDGKQTVEINNIYVPCEACFSTGKSKRYFVPARLQDNPSVDQVAYKKSLAELPPDERAALEHGKWDVIGEGKLFKASWIKHFHFQGDHIVLQRFEGPGGRVLIDSERWFVLLTADTAQKVKTVNDFTCIVAWAICLPNYEMCRLKIIRERMLIPYILPTIKTLYDEWNAKGVIIEEQSSGIAIIQEARVTDRGGGINVIPYVTGSTDKVTRSTDSRLSMQGGNIFFRNSNDTVEIDSNNELLSFPDGTHDDYVDNQSMIAEHCARESRFRRTSNGTTPGSTIKQGMSFPRYNRY